MLNKKMIVKNSKQKLFLREFKINLLLFLSSIFLFSIFFLTYIKKSFVTYIILGFFILCCFNINFDELDSRSNTDSTIYYSKIIFSIINFLCSIFAIFYIGKNKFKIFSWIFFILGIPNLIVIFMKLIKSIKNCIKDFSTKKTNE